MIKYISAIMWKEFKTIKYNFMTKLISQLGISVFATIIFIAKIIMHDATDNTDISKNFLIYILVIIGYVSFISNLRFWQEKSLKTIESLLATPISIKLIIFSKVLAPTLLSSLMILIHYFIYGLFLLIFFKVNLFSIYTLAVPFFISFAFNILYGIINGYGMWCANLTIAKFLQLLSVGIYLTSIFSIFTISSEISILSGSIKYVLIIIAILSEYCLLFTTKEKAITTLQD